jgi:hypothetical protein
VAATDPRSRTFRATFAVDAAVDWINQQPQGHPWMATVAFASDHTPLMQPPYDQPLDGNDASSKLDCLDQLQQRTLSNLMIESMDRDIGRLLVETGLARRDHAGNLVYRPERSDTLVVIVGDNGSLGTTVKLPFNIARSKGTAYQTGVWVPLVVAGPMVKQPGRDVEHMINIADLFSLFGQVAGIDDVQAQVPRPIDAVPMLPYLVDPHQQSIRTWNYAEVGVNFQANGAINGPCVITGGCTQIPVSKSVCEDNNGVWWGDGLDAPITEGAPAGGFTYCCQVNQFVVANNLVDAPYGITPLVSVGIRNDHYKIVQNMENAYISQEQPCVDMTTTEFYEINQDAPIPRLDNEDLMLPLDDLTPVQQANYDELYARLTALRDSVPDCPGDGNIDFVVNQLDIDDWRFYADNGGQSSVYDINLDGLTNDTDEQMIQENLGLQCTGTH